MADLDVDDLLEAPYSKEPKEEPQEKKEKDRDAEKKRKRSRSRSPRRDRGAGDRDRRDGGRRRSRSPRRRRSRSGGRENNAFAGGFGGRRRSRSPYFNRGRRSPAYGRRTPPRRMPGPERRDVMPFTPRLSPPRNSRRIEDLTPEERDARTVFVMQLSVRTRPRDLEEFFSSVGKVRDVRIITDSKTKRSKGIAYVEFYEVDSVNLALGLNNQRLLGAPLMIQPTQAEKNRQASSTIASGFANAIATKTGPTQLFIGSLHYNVTEDMLRGIFEPFGRIESLKLERDMGTDKSRGFGHVTFSENDDAQKAMDHLNGFELAGRQMRVAHATEAQTLGPPGGLDQEEMDRAGLDLGATGRLALMAKLAEGSGMQLPQGAQQVLNANQAAQAVGTPPIATQCFMLSNMFDPTNETAPNWEGEVRDDVIEECSKHGGILHIFVDKASPQGNVYVKCPSVASAVAAVNSLHGRWFAGKVITANYVPVKNYHELFPDATMSMMR